MQFKKIYNINERVDELGTFLWGANYVSNITKQFNYSYVNGEYGSHLEVVFKVDETMLEENFNCILAEMGISDNAITVDYLVGDLTSEEQVAFKAGVNALKYAVPIPIEYINKSFDGFPYYLNEALTEFAKEFKKSLDRQKK